jgi:hypothetical protein
MMELFPDPQALTAGMATEVEYPLPGEVRVEVSGAGQARHSVGVVNFARSNFIPRSIQGPAPALAEARG